MGKSNKRAINKGFEEERTLFSDLKDDIENESISKSPFKKVEENALDIQSWLFQQNNISSKERRNYFLTLKKVVVISRFYIFEKVNSLSFVNETAATYLSQTGSTEILTIENVREMFEIVKTLRDSATEINKKISSIEEALSQVLSDRSEMEVPYIVEPKMIRPKDKWNWIKKEYEKNRGNFQNDKEWAEATTVSFRNKFKTPLGSPQSMKRYAIYGGVN